MRLHWTSFVIALMGLSLFASIVGQVISGIAAHIDEATTHHFNYENQ